MKVTKLFIHKDTIGLEELLRKNKSKHRPMSMKEYESGFVLKFSYLRDYLRLKHQSPPTRAVVSWGRPVFALSQMHFGGEVRIRKSRLYIAVYKHLKKVILHLS